MRGLVKYLRYCALVVLLLQLVGCQFMLLKQDLVDFNNAITIIHGTLDDPDDEQDTPIILVKYYVRNGNPVLSNIETLPEDRGFLVAVQDEPVHLIAIADSNRNGKYDVGERYGLYNDPHGLIPGQLPNEITLKLDQIAAIPHAVSNQLLPFDAKQLSLLQAKVEPLSELHIGAEAALQGMWQPFKFFNEQQTGIFMLQPYDPNKIPVLFVHGIAGFPEQFRFFIDSLDTSRYQPWVASYPSGFSLKLLSYALNSQLEWLTNEYQIKQLHIIAHSMGGLVSRAALLRCYEFCNFDATLTTIATPWGGVESANAGVERAPEVVPAWVDLQTDSEFIQQLAQPLPENFTFNLGFTYRATRIRIENSDNSVTLASQLADYAQQDADQQRGFYQTHTSVLGSVEFMDWWHELVEQPAP